MSAASTLTWEETNQSSLMTALSEVRSALSQFLGRSDDREVSSEDVEASKPIRDQTGSLNEVQPALEILCSNFGLSTFERKILLMCAGMELDSRFASLYREAAGEHHLASPTFSLALAAFDDAHWSALLPGRPLRHWHLLEVNSGDTLTSSPLRIDERILHYLTGSSSMDDRLRGLTTSVGEPGAMPATQRAVSEQIALRWSRAHNPATTPVVQLCASETGSKRAVAVAACALLGLNLRAISGSAIPRTTSELDLFIRLWEREVALHPTGLLLELDEMESSDSTGESSVNRLLETIRSPLLVAVRERRKPLERPLLTFDVPRPTASEQYQIWKEALGEASTVLNGSVERLAAQFRLSANDIYEAVAQALPVAEDLKKVPPSPSSPNVYDGQAPGTDNGLAAGLWRACCIQARPRMEGLAQRIESTATWDDLVLPQTQKQLLAQIAIHVRQRAKVYEQWGFASKGSRGLGISAVFSGPSGTGKTMAGEVLAKELQLDLYRIDLSQVVSKYIGETEKNLRRVFDAAEGGAAVLLFDEADALFGKRSEVKDSHDRYANIEVGYLLQRMEAFRGLAILTTNRKESMDQAFLRRIRFAVNFPFPEFAQRTEIWRRVFPHQTPTEGLLFDKLARLSASGGNIQNIAMGAAFLAAEAGEPVRMTHLLSAARSEFAKNERPMSDLETAGWT